MEVNCEGCAACCIDWRAVAPSGVSLDHERRGPYTPLDESYNLVPLSADEVRAFVDAGFGDALTPRLWTGGDGPHVTVDGHRLAAIDGRPAFFIGLRKPPKPVAPFGLEPAWLPTCVFLDPASLQCRLHGDDHYPDACARYPGDNLSLSAETECERSERAFGGRRLLDGDPDGTKPLLVPSVVGGRLFVHPDPGRLAGAVDRLARGAATDEDRAEFVAVAAASAPGSAAVDETRVVRARARVLDADSWAGHAVRTWPGLANTAPDPSLAEQVEADHGAPATPGWDGV
jgi:hypothetical protein